jgi:membrane-associated phospholipid phosphatase
MVSKIILPFVLCAALVVLSYFFVDKEVAWAIYNHAIPKRFHFLSTVSYVEPALYFFSVLSFLYFLIKYVSFKVTRFDRVLLLASLSCAVASLVETLFLKRFIHRAWTLTWIHNNRSLISDNVYGFRIYEGLDKAYASFPSGHTTVALSVITVFWLLYPKGRPFYVLFILYVVIGLIGMDYHFVSDVIAGGFIGAYAAFWTARIGMPEIKEKGI